MNTLKQNTEGVRINAGAQQYYRQNQRVGDYGKKSSGFDVGAQNKPRKSDNSGGGGGGGGGGSIWDGPLDKQQLRGLQDHIGEYGVRKYPEPDDDEEGWTPGKTPNDIMYSTYNIGDWKTVAKQLNIKNVDTAADVNRLHAYVNNYESNNVSRNNNNGNNKNSSSNADRDSGEFDDIRDALREDAATNFGRADELDNREVDTRNPAQDVLDALTADLNNNGRGNGGRGNGGGNGGGRGNGGGGGGRGNGGRGNGGGGGGGGTPAAPAANPYQDIIDELTASNSELSNYTQQLIDDNAVAQSGYEDSLAAQAEESANSLAGLNDLFTSSFTGINDQMAAQQTDFTDAQAFTQGLLTDQQDAFNTAQAYAQEQFDLQQGAFDTALTGMNEQLALQQGEFATALTGLNDQMAQQQTDFNTAQAFTQEQLSNANAAFLLQQQRNANLQNAYVPGANPNALSVGYGDNRKNKKRQESNNQLSDLTLMSGLGTQSNPLAGLQLA